MQIPGCREHTTYGACDAGAACLVFVTARDDFLDRHRAAEGRGGR